MKLIDLLLQELPKHGGWPEGVNFLEQYTDGSLFCGDTYQSLVRFDRVDDFGYDGVTREQYEAALTAAQEPVWDGEGLPPVGTICEYQTSSNGNLPVRIECLTQDGVAFTWLGGPDQYKGLDCVSAFYAAKYFKPIRSEADTKRAAVVTALAKAGGDAHFEYGRKTIDGELSSPGWYKLYDIIAAGEIAGIRIE
ncbi:hypothetical protein SMY53_000539 [Cronobacter malonaticus]|nr:hypothetical protein [Cronobacter malonaticus]